MQYKKGICYGLILLVGLFTISCAQPRQAYVRIVPNDGYLQRSVPVGLRFATVPAESAEFQPIR